MRDFHSQCMFQYCTSAHDINNCDIEHAKTNAL